MTELERAIRDGAEASASHAYFGARPELDDRQTQRVFEAGFVRGYEAGVAAERKQCEDLQDEAALWEERARHLGWRDEHGA